MKQRRESEASGVHFLGWETVNALHQPFQNEINNPLNRDDVDKAFENSSPEILDVTKPELRQDTRKQDKDIATLEKSGSIEVKDEGPSLDVEPQLIKRVMNYLKNWNKDVRTLPAEVENKLKFPLHMECLVLF